ncbi:hypothetical protein LWI29_009450 [Acer saccharum]|uniref:Uncharacterized protein n=1 Tax=Acer saccharum TaxID=4024 RepID=A0AA39RIN2_ACESA|nr:hypothetical protein LWI29_009450 [Acer saccharum]
MPDEYEDEDRHSTDNHPAPGSRPTSATGPSGTATPTPTTVVADISTLPRRRFRAGTIGGTRSCSATVSASRYCLRGTSCSSYSTI